MAHTRLLSANRASHSGSVRPETAEKSRNRYKFSEFTPSLALRKAVESWISTNSRLNDSFSEAMERLIVSGLSASNCSAQEVQANQYESLLLAQYRDGGIALLERAARDGIFDECSAEFLEKRPGAGFIFKVFREAGERAALTILDQRSTARVKAIQAPK